MILLASMTSISPRAAAADPGLRPWPDNPWYWSWQGQPILLVGGSDDDNLFQWSKADLIKQLDRLAAAGGNVIRNTMSDRPDKGFETYPFKRLADGRYDLERWNPDYWERFERLLRETSQRGIFVQIEIWDRFDYVDSGGSDRWQKHPYNPKNNVNYTYEESGFAQRYPDHPGRNKQPFFFTTPAQRNNRVVLRYQERFVGKLLDHALRYDNVLYCMDNETSGDPAWGRYWAKFIKARAAKAGKTVFVTEMWDDWNLAGRQHKQTFDHPELYDFVDVSQNNQNKGDKHWDNFLYVRNYLATKPRPMNTTKTYGADGNKFGHTDQDAIERVWRHLLAGAASARFHRPPSGLGLNDKAVACIKAVRQVESVVPFWDVEPANELLASREPNEAFLAADPGKTYILYLPRGGEVGLDLSKYPGRFKIRWVNIDTGAWAEQASINGAAVATIKSPRGGNMVAAITHE